MIIFDLDHTLADCEHRRHFVQKYVACDHWHQIPNHPVDMCNECKLKHKNWKPDWTAFYEACDKDFLIEPTGRVYEHIVYSMLSSNVEIWSGRNESQREKTLDWIIKNLYWEGVHREYLNNTLKMRPIGDNTADDQLKEKWLDEALNEGKTIDFVLDSDPKSIEMWKGRGIFVFDVNQSGKEF